MVFFLSVHINVAPAFSADEARDSFVASSIGDARVLIPFLADDASSSGICSMVYNGLTKVDKDLNIIGDLAERWEVLDGGLTIKFYLKKNVRWHDGALFTARDVRFTFEKILDPAAGCPYVSSYADIEEISIVDDYTIIFKYRQPYAPALLKLGMGVIPEHLFRDEKDIRKSKYARAPVGTGPYKFSEWKSDQHIILEANSGYHEHAPRIGRYVFRVIPDQSVEFLELVSGGVDYMELSPYQYAYRSRTPEFEREIEKYLYLSSSYTFLGYNLLDPILKDKDVRVALSHAVNKKEIIDSVLFGLGEECTGPFKKGTPYYDESVLSYEYDPGKARAMLEKAGWKDADGNGILEKDGKEFRLELVTNQGNQAREDVATIVQRQWAKLGVKVEIRVVAWAAFLDQFVDKKNFQAVILGWTIPIDPDIYAVWHSDSAGPGGLNFISYRNGRVDALIEKGVRVFDPRKRKAIYRKLHRLIAADAPYTFLFSSYATPAVNKRFKGIEPAPAGIAYNFIDWYVPVNEVKYKF